MKRVEIDLCTYEFENLEQLIEMLKEDGYIVDLKVKRVGYIRSTTIIL